MGRMWRGHDFAKTQNEGSHLRFFNEYLKDRNSFRATVVKTDTLHLKNIHTETLIYEND